MGRRRGALVRGDTGRIAPPGEGIVEDHGKGQQDADVDEDGTDRVEHPKFMHRITAHDRKKGRGPTWRVDAAQPVHARDGGTYCQGADPDGIDA